MCEVLIKEKPYPPFHESRTIEPIHFSDSLQFISPIEKLPLEPIRYRMITCTTKDDLFLFFKTIDDQLMIVMTFLFGKGKLQICVKRWNDLEKRYIPASMNDLTAAEERAILCTVRSVSIRSGQKIRYCLF
ncbi:hypothetical protein NBU54_12060 [Anoxybacillus gonensis]|uniref:Uncharacterized protein n=2 Tax=Anoxybacillaceae TaxID=3120669 RepID=A0AAW7TL49_9BACL|nr:MULTISPECIES: hypothetical protein [Anoxybacillus]MDO0878403.1 hypothetical protein [Anoxybacillus gonensis]